MNISQLLVRVRDQLDDPGGTKYTDAEIVRHVDEQARTMFRKYTQQNREQHNFALCIQKEDGRELFQGTWEWRLPTWIDRVIRIFERDGSGTVESTYSPYLWTASNGVRPGREVPKTDMTRRQGWTWEGQHTLRLWNYTTGPELLLFVNKVPPPSFKVKILTAYAGTPTTGGLYLPQTSQTSNWIYGDQSQEEGAYINAEVQVTATASATDTNLGAVRRVVYSRPNAIVSATRQYEVVLETVLGTALSPNDFVETMLPVPEAFVRLLVLLTLQALFVKKNNIDAMKSIAGELGKEWSEFLQYATMPRDNAGPVFKVSATSNRRRVDMDMLPPFSWVLYS